MALRTRGALIQRWSSPAHPYVVIHVQVIEGKEFSLICERWLLLEARW